MQWLNRFNPYTYILYAMAVDQLGQNEQRLITPDGRVTTVSQFMKDYFGYDYGFRWCASLPDLHAASLCPVMSSSTSGCTCMWAEGALLIDV